MPLEFAGAALPLGPNDIAAVAAQLKCEVAAVWAVCDIESSGGGFLPDKRPKILYEAHVFGQLTGHEFDQTHPNVSAPAWNRALYGADGAHQYDRLAEAISLNRAAALQAASWGMFQIMGMNYETCSYGDVETFVAAMCQSAGAQLAAFAAFCQHSGLDKALRAHDWTTFALCYNGSGQAENQYDSKLAAAYARRAREPDAATAAQPSAAAPSAQSAALPSGHLSPHFTLAELTFSETAQRRGIPNDPSGDPAIMAPLTALAANVLEPIRAKYGPFSPTSGYRSPAVNEAVGGVGKSQHMLGQAADIRIAGVGLMELATWVRDESGIEFDQLILEYGSWVHVSHVPGGPNRRQVLSIRQGEGYTTGLHL